MTETVIKVEKLGKQYEIGNRENSFSLRDMIVETVKMPFKLIFGKKNVKKHIWALKDVSFEVKKGEVIGIIGRNGAGKSTLLKILSRITEPSVGQITINGRVASLLEVGTGFHPELTGRENIYLNGAILGMKKEEIDKKFHNIVEFSGVAKFLDTPVKKYSSGMYVRLAFAVAAHLEPEILLVDEVLSVGDAEFQKKCLGKMSDVAKGGRTVIFVSHNMPMIKNICKKAILISIGSIIKIGNTEDVINVYLKNVHQTQKIQLKDRTDRAGKGLIKFLDINIASGEGNIIRINDDIFVTARIRNLYNSDKNVRLSISIRTNDELGLISCDSLLQDNILRIRARSDCKAICRIVSPSLNVGTYKVNIAVYLNEEAEDWIINAAEFVINYKKFDDHIRKSEFPILTKFNWKLI